MLHGEGSAVEGFAIAQNGALSVALDTTLDDELVREGRVRELVHRINAMRRDAGLELSDRIAVTLGPEEADLVDHEAWIKEETLAVEVRRRRRARNREGLGVNRISPPLRGVARGGLTLTAHREPWLSPAAVCIAQCARPYNGRARM